MKMSKPIVHFKNPVSPPIVGGKVWLTVIDHPRQAEFDEYDGFVRTSEIITVTSNKAFETKNTIYHQVWEQ